ncbi:helix-turn-helix domain-containing protein [Jatrophihabitans endophyticus]|uniref:helix-turn-helix domain-containing protein n=1 Tax=Jatrophihabitans endophyticus TaxID=1206085 RepID=UPI001A09EA65|nr:helix-turn-helix domain-containing protein [Jatrophihabitans endophyticus]MBE7187982.1 helix-turn-helix domain-containing protein [Jatrophihabitans endophyticus]
MSSKDRRDLTDLKAIAAMSHPLRRRLMDVLTVDGPATASMLAERTDQAVGNISHHMRTLADCELVEEAPELARDRRERWWRLAHASVRWSTANLPEGAATEVIEQAAVRTNLDRQFGYVEQWNAVDGPDERTYWRTGPFSTSHWLRLTDAELAQVADEITAVFDRWSDREVADDGAERRTVFAFAHGVPATP